MALLHGPMMTLDVRLLWFGSEYCEVGGQRGHELMLVRFLGLADRDVFY